MMADNNVELDPTGANVEEFIGTTDVPSLVSVPKEPATFKQVYINKVILTPELMNTARDLFPQAKQEAIEAGDMSFPRTSGGFLANDLVDTMRVDFKDRLAEDPNYITYESLRNGTATILDEIEIYAGKSPKERMLTDDDIAKIFSNAEDAPFARAFFGELAKTVPALQAGMSTTALTAAKLYSKPLFPVGTPLSGAEWLGKTVAALGTGVAVGFGVYSAADAIEEGFLGPDPVVVPGQRAAYEAFRTAGGGAANILFPFMLSRYTVDSGARFVLDNLARNIKGPIGLRIQASLDEMLAGSARLATGSRTGAISTAIVESGGALGSAGAAYLAEDANVGTGGRLLSEFIGGNIGALTVLKALPKALTSLTDAGGVEGITSSIGDARQKKVFSKISELYQKFGDQSQYDELLENLTSPAFKAEMEKAFPGVDFSVGQRSGDPLFMALEASRSAKSEDLSAARKKSERLAFEATNNFIKALTAEGSEASLNAAAQLRKSLFDEAVQNNISVPLARLAKSIAQLKKLPVVDGDPTVIAGLSPAALSKKLTDVLENQLFTVMGAKERALYTAAGARDHVVYDLSEGVPEFIKVFDEISYLNPSVQAEFEKSMPEIALFIKQAKRDLGLDVEGGESFNLTALQSEVDQTTEILSKYVPVDRRKERGVDYQVFDFEDFNISLSFMKNSFKEKNLSFDEQADIFEKVAKDKLSLSEKINDGASATPSMAKESREAYANVLLAEAGLARAKATRGMVGDEAEAVVITAGKIDEIRSRALALGREFTSGLYPAKSDYGRRLGQLANSLREGLDAVEGGAPEAYKNALAFTRAKHDVVSRMVNAKAKSSLRSGARAIDPEIQFSTYINANPSVTLGRTRQLQALAQFADDQDLASYALEAGVEPGVDPVFTTINNLTDAYLRKTQIDKVITKKFDSTLNREVIEVNDQKLAEWRDANSDLLEAFPQIDIDTADAVTFQRSLEFKQARKAKLDKKGLVQQQLGSLLNGRSPTEAIGEAFEAAQPADAMRKLFNIRRVAADFTITGGRTRSRVKLGTPKPNSRTALIQEAGLKVKDVNEGFRTAILQQAMMRAGGEVGGKNKTFDPKTFHEFMFKPMGKSNQVSVADLALKNDIFTEGQFKRLKFMSTQMVRIQAADAAGRLKDPDFADEAGAIVDFYYSVVGSALGSAAYSATSSVLPISGSAGQLAASSAGAKYIRTIMQSIPAVQNLETLDQAFMDAELVSKLLRRPTNAADAERQRFSVGNHLKEMFFTKGATIGREMIPFVARETFEEDDNTVEAPYLGFPGFPENAEKNRQQYIDRIRRNLPPNDQQGAFVPPSNFPARPSPVVSPTTQASAVPSPAPAPINSGPVDRTRYAALFPNDSISGMMKTQMLSRGGIASLMR